MQIRLETPSLVSCPRCGKPKRPHAVCLNCGYYRGREVLDVLGQLSKKERKKREKEIKAKEKEAGEKETPKKPLSWKELSTR